MKTLVLLTALMTVTVAKAATVQPEVKLDLGSGRLVYCESDADVSKSQAAYQLVNPVIAVDDKTNAMNVDLDFYTLKCSKNENGTYGWVPTTPSTTYSYDIIKSNGETVTVETKYENTVLAVTTLSNAVLDKVPVASSRDVKATLSFTVPNAKALSAADQARLQDGQSVLARLNLSLISDAYYRVIDGKTTSDWTMSPSGMPASWILSVWLIPTEKGIVAVPNDITKN